MRLSQGWHYGHVPHAFERDVDGDGLPEVVLVGVANERHPGSEPDAKEPLRPVMMVIDPLRKEPWAWSMNDWMNDPEMAPLAYGVVTVNSWPICCR